MNRPDLGITSRVSSVAGGITGRIARIPSAIAGSPRALPTRLIVFFTVMAGLTALVGVFGILASGVSIDADSGPVLRALFETLLNTYLWAFLFLGIAAVIWSKLYDLMAARTAASTRFSARTIRRLAAEAKSTDGTTRLTGSNEHSRDQLFAKLMRVYRSTGGVEDERPGHEHAIGTSATTDPSALDAPEQGGALTEARDERAGRDDLEDRSEYERLEAEYDELAAEADALSDEIEADLNDVLAADADPEQLAEALESGERRVAPAELLGDEDSETFDEAKAKTERLDDIRTEMARIAEELVELESKAETTDTSDADLPQLRSDVADADEAETTTNTDTDTDEATIERASIRDALAVMRMDLAASLNLSEVLWRWLLPFVVTVLASFTLIQRLAVQWYVFMVIFSVAAFVATAYYGVFKWRRARRLRSLRSEPRPTGWKSCTCLAKRVDTDEATGYYAFVGGRVYFDFDAVRLSHTVADRWYRHLNDEAVPPAMQEKFARNVKGMLPTVYHTEHDQSDGRPAIYDDIIRVIAEARDPHGIVPKSELCERVVERGRDGGHDPDVVAECYADMVPSVVTERDIYIEDTDGETREMTVVHLREHTITSQLAQLRSQFSSRVSADASGTYTLPEVDRAEIDRERPPDIQPSRHLSRGD